VYCAEYDDSVAYVDHDDEDDSSQPIYRTMPYICGRVMLTSVLDLLVSMVRIIIVTKLLTDAQALVG